MKNSTYSISKYIIFELRNGEAVVQNQDSIVIINNKIMIDLLKYWDTKQVRRVNKDEIKVYFNEDIDDAIEFMKQYQILKEEKPKKLDINKISIYSNHNDVALMLEKIVKEDYKDRINIHLLSSLDDEKATDDELLLAFLNPYSKKLGKQIMRRQSISDNSKLILSYVYNSNFYIDCLYSSEWKVPCHNCHIGHIEAQSYLEEDTNMTYQQIIDLLYSVDEDFKVEIPLSGLQKINITRLLLNKLNKYINDFNVSKLHPAEITTCTLMDLSSLKIYEDTSIHWELCDCYEN